MVSVSGTVTEYYGTTEFADPLGRPARGDRHHGVHCRRSASPRIPPYLDPYADPSSSTSTSSRCAWRSRSMAGSSGHEALSFPRPAGDPEIALVDYRSSIPGGNRVFERTIRAIRGSCI